MEKISDLSVSPNKLRINYTLGSKSNKLVSIKKTNIKTAETTRESLTSRAAITPIRENAQNTSVLLTKLQEELDVEELAIKINKIKDLPEEKRLKKENFIYEQYLEQLFSIVLKSDKVLGNSIFRGWKGFKSCVNRKINEITIDANKKAELNLREKGCQVSEEMLIRSNEAEIEKYINSLHKVIKGMGEMQMDKIIDKLSELSYNMKPTNLPELSDVADVQEIDFTDTLKSIYTKLRTKVKYAEIPQVEIFFKARTTQTYLSLEDFRTAEVYKVLLLEKEKKIENLESKLSKIEDLEELLRAKSKECEELRKKYIDMKISTCSNCRIKREMLETSNSKIKNLQMTIEKGLSVEKELEITKAKLVESNQIISNNEKKIIELTTGLDTLNTKLQENKIAQQELETQLLESEKGLENSLQKLEKSEKRRADVESKLKSELALIEKLKKKLKNATEENSQLRKEKAKTQKLLKFNNKNEEFRTREKYYTKAAQPDNQDGISAFEHHEKISTQSPEKKFIDQNYTEKSFIDKNQMQLWDKKRILFRDEFNQVQSTSFEDLNHPLNEEILQNDEQLDKKVERLEIQKIVSKKKTVIEWLKITKQEYLALSKKARLELFECLYEHKDKCGAECEHLKRAMLIRARDKGQLFPTKKYNIN